MGALCMDDRPVSNMKESLRFLKRWPRLVRGFATDRAPARRWVAALFVAVAVTCAGVAAAEDAPTAPTDPSPVILVLGDSLSAAYGIALDQGWVHLLQQRIESAGLDYRVVNASVSGDTVASGLSRLPGLLEAHAPALVVVELGGNDGLRGFTPAQIADYLEQIIAASRKAGADVLLTGVRLPPNYGTAYTERFQRMYLDVAERQRVALVPRLLEGIAEDRSLMQPDGVHPVAAAQPRMLDNVWPVLAPMLDGGR
jgi:acyl-CoA thioesterase-1